MNSYTFYHKSDCPGSMHIPAFQPAVMKNRTGYYVGYLCDGCGVGNRESGYYDSEKEAWSDYELLSQGLPLTNPREPESEDETLIRRLKAAGLDPKPDESNEFDPPKQARVMITPNGEVDIEIEDPMGTRMRVRFHITEWGLLGTTDTGFGSTITDDGFLLIVPDSDHIEQTMEGLQGRMDQIRAMSEELNNSTQNIDSASMGVV